MYSASVLLFAIDSNTGKVAIITLLIPKKVPNYTKQDTVEREYKLEKSNSFLQ